MNTKLANVLEFHITYKQPVRDYPEFNIPKKEYELRIDLMTEELLEYEQGFHNNDLVEMADALCDMLYVVYGTILFHGLHHGWSEIYKSLRYIIADDVRDNNYNRHLNQYKHAVRNSPIGKNGIIVYSLAGMRYYIHKKVEQHVYPHVFELLFAEVQRSNMSKLDKDGNPIFREDGKVLKGENYFKPNIKGILADSGLL